MAFDDLANEDVEERDPGDEAMDELAGTLSGTAHNEDSADDSSEPDEEESGTGYDPATDPAFPTAKERTQHSVYCLPSTWDAIDGPDGLLFEAEILLRRNGYGAVQKRELHNAFLQAAIDNLAAEDIADTFIATREAREAGPLLEES